MTGLWLRCELRRRWKAIVVLGVLAGVTAGLAMAAVDGARRSATVQDRVSAVTKQPDVMVLPSRPHFDWKPIERLPEVKAIGLFGVTQDLGAIGLSIPGQPSGFPPVNQAIGRDVDVIRVEQGRPIDPHNPHEVLVTAGAVHFMHLHIGQRFQITGSTMAEINSQTEGPASKRPKVWVKIVGISAHDSLWGRYLGDSGQASDPESVGLVLSPALVEHYDFGYLANALVRLRHGSADVARFRQDVARVEHDTTIPVRDLSEDSARFGRALTVEESALLLFALAVTVAGLVLIGQALARLVQSSASDAQTLSALGATRSQAVRAVATQSVVVAGVAAVTSTAAMLAFSTRFPIGLARGLELDLGVRLDWLVLTVGILAVIISVVAAGILGAWFAVSPRAPSRRRALAGVMATALHLPLPAEFGVRMALNRGRGRNSVPVRSALFAAMAGVLGIVGAFTFRAGLDHAVGNVTLAGTTWQRVAMFEPSDDLSKNPPIPNLSKVPGLRAAAEVYRTGVNVSGDTVSAWSFEPLVGRVRRVVTSGREPDGPDEVLLGWQTAHKVHAGVGSTVRVNGEPHEVVGIGFLPEQPGHSAYDQGMWLTKDGFARVYAAGRSKDIDDREVLADFRDVHLHVPATISDLTGNDPASRNLTKALRHLQPYVGAATIPAAMANLGNVRGLPLALGTFLVLLAVGALGHALVSSVARRRHDLAVLRSLGITPRQSRSMIAVHATVVGLVGLVVGVPLGFVIGRFTWRWVAEAVPFLYVAPLALVAGALAIPAALIIANVVAAAPARVASHVRPAEILRSE